MCKYGTDNLCLLSEKANITGEPAFDMCVKFFPSTASIYQLGATSNTGSVQQYQWRSQPPSLGRDVSSEMHEARLETALSLV